jgi:hypothetical protein
MNEDVDRSSATLGFVDLGSVGRLTKSFSEGEDDGSPTSSGAKSIVYPEKPDDADAPTAAG